MSDNSSENSSAKSDSATDLNSKYTRLAAEYSKLRAQNVVLKKAVVDEQTKNSELNEVVRSKSQMIRKADQEMEALKFRNSQLTVRITVLQEELDSKNNKANKKSKRPESSNGVVDSTFLDAEIEKTMMEHAKLISELSRKDETHDVEVKALKNEIVTLNYELEQKNIKLRQILEEHRMEVQQLKKEQQEMKREYASKVIKLKETEVELTTFKKVHKTYVDENGPKLEALIQLLPRKIPFVDEENESLNRLNVHFSIPTYDEDSHIKQLHRDFASLLMNFYNIIHNVTLELKESGLETLRTYLKTLVKIDDEVQLYERLNACYPLLNDVGFQSSNSNSVQKYVHEFIKCFLDFAVSVQSSYSKSCHSIRYGSSTSPHIGDVPVKVVLEIFQIKKNGSFFISSTHLYAFCDVDEDVRLDLIFDFSDLELIAKIITLPNSQHSLIHEEFEHFNEAVQKFVHTIDLIDKSREKSSNNKLENNVEFRRKAIIYLNSLKREPAERISYEEALKNKIKLQEYEILINSLKQEIKALENTITALEQGNIRVPDECLEEETTNFRDDIEPVVQEKTNELGKFTSTCELPTEILAREKKILHHMNGKLIAVVVEKHEALSKARYYILECKALRRRLEYCVTEKQLLEQKYLKSQEASSELKEELSTVSQNYESHLSVMSDHLANVNEKLATQSEEIDKLHYQLHNKELKKKKLKS